jgi:DNA-binding MarR family transcriptional regulator
MTNERKSSEDLREHRRAVADLKRKLRELNNQVALLNYRVGALIELRDVDLDSLDYVVQHGPLSPTVLARRIGLHPATMTGVLDRLERGGWILRERDAADRRSVLLRANPERAREVYRLYDGMNDRLDEVCAAYDPAQLATITDFLTRAREVGELATEELATPR